MNFESFFFRAGEKLQKSLKPAPLLRKVDFCFAPVKNAQTAKKRKNVKNWGEQFPPILKAGGTRFLQKTKHFIIKAVCVKLKAGLIFPPKPPDQSTDKRPRIAPKIVCDFDDFRCKIWTFAALPR